MTMMLADLSLINCTGSSLNDEERDDILLKSAKNNLQVFAFLRISFTLSSVLLSQ